MAIGFPCKSCGELIVMLRTAEGGRMPVELTSCGPDDDSELTRFDPLRHTNHWTNCPGASRHRKKK